MSIVLPIIELGYQTGLTIYCRQVDRLTGKVWNTNSSAFEVYNAANWAHYAIALTEQSPSSYYTATRPAGVSGFLVSDVFYQQGGGSPVDTDVLISVGYSLGQNEAAISGDPVSAPTNLQAVLDSQTQGAVATGTITTSSFPTNLTNPNAGAYQGRVIYFTSGAAAGLAALIANYTVSNGVLTLSGSLAVAPSSSDKFIIA